MFPVVKLTSDDLDINAQSVIKAADYQCLQDAREKAAEIMRQAEEIYESEKNRGYQEGLAYAKHKEVELLLANAARIIRSYEEVEQNLTDLVISSVRKILNEFDKEELAYQIVRKALYQLGEAEKVTVKIPKDVAESVRGRIQEALAFYPGLEKFEVRADPALADGDCRIESNFGVISANLEEQVSALTSAMNSQISAGHVSRKNIEIDG